ncbi:LytR/AlgR family response regulator transcription factor [Larkinella soli]|uniref:LytR/AlgR family response regulator transcription factor n=1 Tax=Larkinella soli TaxID=1770527 RepID=UPI000FFC47C2|nr:LytTR family DNA-binding domain-containing protein [Larkinella soli]
MNRTRIVYRDRWVILTGSLLLGYFFVNLGQTESLFELWKQSFYLRDILITSAISALVWLGVRTATVSLDGRLDWFGQPVRRAVAQFFAGFLGPVVVCLLLVLVFFEFVIGQDIMESTFPIYEFPVSLLVIAMMNLFYLGYYLYRKAADRPEPTPGPEPRPVADSAGSRKILVVNSGQRNIPVPTTEVAYFFIEESFVYATLFSGDQYLISTSLDDLTQSLPADSFFRANRQFLLNRRSCRSFLNAPYGKLKVEVSPTLTREVIISQQKAPEFRKWLEEPL